MRSMVEGAHGLNAPPPAKRSDDARAPSTILLRKMVPLPRFAGKDEG
jgi:hypothetical protein